MSAVEMQIATHELPQEVAAVTTAAERRVATTRLQSLGNAPDADFDRLAGLATGIFGAPIGLLTLLDPEVQHFRGVVGTDLRETATRDSFCAHAIAAPEEVTVVSDARIDPRFSENPFVTGEPHIAFYAGAPIEVFGQRVGSVCVMDSKPRTTLDAHQLTQLKALAELAASLFALKDSSRTGTQTAAALARTEMRHRLALEAAVIASWVWYPKQGFVECDPLMTELFGLPISTRVSARRLFFAIDRRDLRQTNEKMQLFMATSDDYAGEYRIGGNNPARWLATRGRVVERDPQGAPTLVIGVSYDISARKAIEETQRLLLRELNHRVKNTLATIQALASQTVRHSQDPRQFLDAFSGRLQALGRAHGLLSDLEWRGVGLKHLLKLQTDPFDDLEHSRIDMAGPDILITPEQAIALSLLAHELASNALKHGALSVDTGRVSLTWRVDVDPDGKRLVLDWIERGGPHVSAPERHGFGSILIRRSLDKLISSKVTHAFEPEGVRAEIVIPIEEISGS